MQFALTMLGFAGVFAIILLVFSVFDRVARHATRIQISMNSSRCLRVLVFIEEILPDRAAARSSYPRTDYAGT
jgi:hypothetical protein